MKVFFPALAAILVAVGIIYLAYKIPHDIRETNQAERALRDSIAHSDAFLRAYKSVYSTPTPPEITTLSGKPAVIVIRPVRVNIPQGEVIIPKGERLRLISETPEKFTVDYNGYPVVIPIEYARRYLKK